MAGLRPDPDPPDFWAIGAAGFRDAWATLEPLWDSTIDWARTPPAEALHEQVNGEWSFIETLRHVTFAIDAWLSRAVLGNPTPYDAMALPHDEMADVPAVPRDRSLRPSLDEVLAVLAPRRQAVGDFLAGLTDERLDAMTEPVLEPGYPESESYAVRRCLRAVVNEAWWHRRYAERDLALLGVPGGLSS